MSDSTSWLSWLQSHYLPIKHLHMSLAGASAALFLARALGVQWRHEWPMQPLARRLSVLIDTALLSAGVSLWLLLGLQLGQTPWLMLKLTLLLAYIVAGSYALKRARTPRGRRLALLLALGLLLAIVATARSHLSGWV